MLGSTGSAASDRSLPVRFMCEFPLCVSRSITLSTGVRFGFLSAFSREGLAPASDVASCETFCLGRIW